MSLTAKLLTVRTAEWLHLIYLSTMWYKFRVSPGMIHFEEQSHMLSKNKLGFIQMFQIWLSKSYFRIRTLDKLGQEFKNNIELGDLEHQNDFMDFIFKFFYDPWIPIRLLC